MSKTLISSIFLANIVATSYMTGLIWFVQVVHYPLFGSVGTNQFTEYEQQHTALTTWVVAPPMLIEAATAILLLWFRPTGVPSWQAWVGVALVAVLWLSTALIQVPCHETLSQGFDAAVHQRLVVTNWLRTVAWSMRALLAAWMALKALS